MEIDAEKKRLGETIRNSRKEKNMTQADLAKKAGVSGMTIQRYEAGKTFPDIGNLIRIASALSDTRLVDAAYQTDSLLGKEQNGIRKDVNRALINIQIENNNSEEYTKQLMIVSMLLSTLNRIGMKKAVEAVEIITKVSDYVKKEEAE